MSVYCITSLLYDIFRAEYFKLAHPNKIEAEFNHSSCCLHWYATRITQSLSRPQNLYFLCQVFHKLRHSSYTSFQSVSKYQIGCWTIRVDRLFALEDLQSSFFLSNIVLQDLCMHILRTIFEQYSSTKYSIYLFTRVNPFSWNNERNWQFYIFYFITQLVAA